MSSQEKKKWKRAAWAVPLLTIAGFALALPTPTESVPIDELHLSAEEANQFDRSVRVGLDAETYLEARGSIDTVTPNVVINNTNIDTVTPNVVINNTNINTVTPNVVINNTNINTVTPNMVINNTNIATTTPGVVINGTSVDEEAGPLSFFPTDARLPEPSLAAGIAVEGPRG